MLFLFFSVPSVCHILEVLESYRAKSRTSVNEIMNLEISVM